MGSVIFFYMFGSSRCTKCHRCYQERKGEETKNNSQSVILRSVS